MDLLLKSINDALCDRNVTGISASELLALPEIAELTADKARLDWLEKNPARSEIKGGSDDGHTGTFWGCGSANMSLRETIDAISGIKP